MIFSRQPYIPLAFVIVFSLVMLKLPGRTSAQLKLAISGLFLPLVGLSTSGGNLAGQGAQAVLPRAELNRQIENLHRENSELRLQLLQANAALAENARLRQALQFSTRAPWKLKLARVVGRDPANWWRTLRIDVGLRDGVSTNAPVLTPEGLVGRVSLPGYSHSQVVLLGDPDCRVSALIEETRDHGVVAPDSASPLDNILVDLSYLSRNSPLKAGQRVVTSGLGGIFPKGILVGQIVDFHSVDFGLYIEARVRVAAKLNALEEVWVIMD